VTPRFKFGVCTDYAPHPKQDRGVLGVFEGSAGGPVDGAAGLL
jgi:hypothetical protein